MQHKKYYALEMFPYPSGANLHMGHFFNFAPSDTHARFKKMCGHDVFHPMGFDAFGLPAENHALKTGTHPHTNTVENIKKFREQLGQLGGMYDWEHTLASCFPEYYKWTQWLFLQLFNNGLAYQKESSVNWCSSCATVIANEQVLGGECERCNTAIVKKPMKQWFFKITDFAEELLAGLDKVDWPERTKAMQRNWIGKSVGHTLKFDDIEVFTTRLDTILGATFIAIAPEHPLAAKFDIAKDYIKQASAKSELERQENKIKTGVFTGAYAKNPATGKDVPIWVADYVLIGYGTGAVMGVPAHDERDHEFATKYNLPIIDELLDIPTAVKKTKAKPKTTYRLRDWSVSRQRYWGAPIPIIHCADCGAVASEIPVILPHLQDFAPKGAPPLANDPDFVNCTCPKCGKPAKRETETMDTFVCSSWYFLRFPFANRDDVPFEKSVQPVDMYVGGAEHSCGHLLYARFITKVLHKLGHIKFDEPFKRLIHQGMILAPDGQKMSKSKGNTISPDKYIQEFGSDVVRLYMLFGFNYTEGGPWNDGALRSTAKFITRVENLVGKITTHKETNPDVLHVMANTIKSVREDLDNFSFNTAVARCMEFVNAISAAPVVSKESVALLTLVLAPMIPVTAQKLWEQLGHSTQIITHPYPNPNPAHLQKNTVEIAVQVNSKITSRITIPTNATQAEVEKLCGITGAKKVIYIPGKLINFIKP